MSDAEMAAMSWFPEMYVVWRTVELQYTIASVPKLLPFTVSINAGPPDVALVGINCVMAGPTPAVIIMLLDLDPYPPQLAVNKDTSSPRSRIQRLNRTGHLRNDEIAPKT